MQKSAKIFYYACNTQTLNPSMLLLFMVRCASFCAKEDGEECLANYRPLCEIAVAEADWRIPVQDSVALQPYVCDVNCTLNNKSNCRFANKDCAFVVIT